MVANAEIVRQFREMADLLELQDANPFRVRAYLNAARVIEGWPDQIAARVEKGQGLGGIPGIGADLAGKIEEIVRTGTFAALREASEKVPRVLLEILRIPGLGPKKARALHEKLKVASLAELEQAAKAGQVARVPGFSVKTQSHILEELKRINAAGERFLRAAVEDYAEPLAEYLRGLKGVMRAEIAGSYRRCRETVGDVDIVAAVTPAARQSVLEAFTGWREATEVVERGDTSASIRLRSGLRVDLELLEQKSFGAGLLLHTGSRAHVEALLKLGRLGKPEDLAGMPEEEIYRSAGLQFIPPEMRENRGEIELAERGRLPRLLELKDIRGDLQMHTVESDGAATLEQMAQAAQEMGYEYIAVTDHSPLLPMIQGLDAGGFRRQWERVDRLNGKLKKLTLLKAAEVDIHEDGTLDLPDDVLAEADLVVVSIHTKFRLPPAEQTRRVVRALSHPSADVFGHPRGRMLLKREGAMFDMDTVCRAAADHGVMMEVNSEPDRLDLDELSIRTALERGVRLVVSTDAHHPRELKFIRWGVAQARRGWATKADVANTLPLARFRKLLHGSR